MKFRYKVLVLCILVYVISLVAVGIIVTENNYVNLLNKELERSLGEEENLYNNIRFYLYVNDKKSDEMIKISDYSQALVDIFGDEKRGIEIFDSSKRLLASNTKVAVKSWNEDLETIFGMERSYVLRRNNHKHFLYINHKMELNDESFIISYIKDITHVDEIKSDERNFFAKVGFIGFIVITIVIILISKIIIKPIEILSETALKITDGNYDCRVQIKGKDEIGVLADQFNKMAEQVENKINELKEEGERKQRFIDNLTHELRTPLTSIIGYSELLMGIKYDEERFYRGLNYINSEGERLLKMSKILMSMILVREECFELKEENIVEVLSEAVEIMKIRADKKNIHLNIKGEECFMSVHRDTIKLVLINLIDNAIKASYSGGRITLGVESCDRKSCVYVKDEGRGMDQEHIKKVFEPFYRVHKSRSRKEGGAGLGLALCNEIVKRHNGELKIESKIEVGTIVKVIL